MPYNRLISQPFKRQPHKMVKHTQTIRRILPTNCLSMFDHFVGLALKGLSSKRQVSSALRTRIIAFFTEVRSRGIFRTLSNIYDGTFLRNLLMAKRRLLMAKVTYCADAFCNKIIAFCNKCRIL